MKRIKFIVKSSKSKIAFLLFLLSFNSFGQCPPDDFPNDYVYLITQEDVDNFIIDYPNCTSLQTLLIGDIIPSTITNLNGLINLESIGWLQITNIPVVNLQGLNNIHTVDRFVIYYMPDLLSLEGLDRLETVTGEEFRIELCGSISNFIGLENFNSFDGNYFTIRDNDNLNDISGLDCYFFTEDFRNGMTNYSVQSSLFQSIFDICGIELSNDDFTSRNFNIYPNPVQNKLFLQSPTNDFLFISITDINGRMVFSMKNHISNEIDVSALKSGMYFIRIQSSEGNITKKFIKN